jgi:hypothetical protein
MRALVLAWRAERLATTRTRIASTAPSLDLGLPLARPLRAVRAASTASRGSDLAGRHHLPNELAGMAGLDPADDPTCSALEVRKARDPVTSPDQVQGQGGNPSPLGQASRSELMGPT